MSFGPPIPPERLFATGAHRDAAAAIVATVRLAHDRPDLIAHDGDGADELARFYADVAETVEPLDVVVAASVIVGKLLADERIVWHVDPLRTLTRLGVWVASDEFAEA